MVALKCGTNRPLQRNPTGQMDMTISWYPGHMFKANKEMAKIIKEIDVIIEILDARMPAASANPLLKKMRGDKPCLQILNKADMAQPEVTR
jgi:ribosome biogenesis GTPase A